MRSFAKHINFFRYIVPVLFFVANTGFTIILHYCCDNESDDESTHEVEALSEGPVHSHEGKNALQFNVRSFSDPGDGCHRQKVAGGLTDILATTNNPARVVVVDVKSAPSIDCKIITPGNFARTNLTSLPLQQRVLSPPVERYVLNEAILI